METKAVTMPFILNIVSVGEQWVASSAGKERVVSSRVYAVGKVKN